MILLLTIAALLMDGGAGAAVSPLEKPLNTKGERYLSNLHFTGETESCIGGWDDGAAKRIKRTIGLDEFHILFEMADENYFITEIPGDRGCSGAGAPGYVTIEIDSRARNPRKGICAGDRAKAFRNSGGNRVTGRFCVIGEFHRLVRNSEIEEATE